MAGFLQRLRARWNKDGTEMAEEEPRTSAEEREDAREDYRGQKDEAGNRIAANRVFPGSGGRFEFEGDSKPPRP
jgi:hypothetical protein